MREIDVGRNIAAVGEGGAICGRNLRTRAHRFYQKSLPDSGKIECFQALPGRSRVDDRHDVNHKIIVLGLVSTPPTCSRCYEPSSHYIYLGPHAP
jgi:hypothetical protein